MIKFQSLKQSKQFLRILKKKRLNTKYFTIYFEKNLSSAKKNDKKFLNISFVMKKNIGNAVIRNKIKRKLKSAVQKVLKEKQPVDLNYTYVIFGRNNVYKDKFRLIFDEVNDMFKRIKQIAS
ncbi:MAG: ribonuclease P protein component [Alphaproteobacteria bacterium]|nr:MAG: ribonuclease P protein component [Alphaproteobacteria bacterium]